MKIDMMQELKDLDGNAIPNVTGICLTCGRQSEDKGPHTLRTVCVDALLTDYQDERSLKGDDKMERFLLAQKVHDDDKPDLSAEDVVLLKKMVAKRFTPLVVGRAWAMLEV